MTRISPIRRVNYVQNTTNIAFRGKTDDGQEQKESSSKKSYHLTKGLSRLVKIGIPVAVLATCPLDSKVIGEEVPYNDKTKEEYVVSKSKSSVNDKNVSNSKKSSVSDKTVDWEQIKKENELKEKAINGDTAGPIMKAYNQASAKVAPFFTFIDENGFNALRKAQQSKGRATVIAGETKGPVGYGASFVTELVGEAPDTLRGVTKRGSDLYGWIKDKTKIYNGDNKALQTLNITSDMSQMLQGIFQFIESGSSIATGTLTYERWRNKNIDKNIKRVNSELARRSVDMSDANAHDSKVIIKGKDRMIMAFGEEKYRKMTKEEREEYAKSLPKTMTLEHAKFIQTALKDLPLEDFSKETLIMLSKLSAAQFAAHEHAELRTNYIMEGLQLFNESKTNVRDGASKVLKTPGNLISGIGETADIGMVDEDNDFDDKVIEGLFGKRGFLGIFHNTLSAAGNTLNIPMSVIDGKEGSTTEAAQTALQKTKDIGKSIVNMFSLGLTNAYDVWGDYENDAKNPKAKAQVSAKPSEVQQITARQLRVLMVQSSENAYIMDYYKKLDDAMHGFAKAIGDKAYSDTLAGEKNPSATVLKKAEAKRTQIEQDILLKLQAARKQALQLINKTNKADAKRQARLAEYYNTFFDYFKLEESNDKNYANTVPLGKTLLCVGEGFVKTIPYEIIFESNQSANTAIAIPLSFLTGGVKVAYEGVQELNEYLDMNGDSYNGALKMESVKGSTKAVTKIASGTAIALIPMIKNLIAIKAKAAAAHSKMTTTEAEIGAATTKEATAATTEMFAYGNSAAANTANISINVGAAGASSTPQILNILSPKKIVSDNVEKVLKNMLPSSLTDSTDTYNQVKSIIKESTEKNSKKVLKQVF